MKPYTPQSREYYISKCRYYNGDDSSDIPAEDKLLAYYEECWVRFHYKEEDLEYLRECLKDYKAFGLGHFNESSDGVPITLKALYGVGGCTGVMVTELLLVSFDGFVENILKNI